MPATVFRAAESKLGRPWGNHVHVENPTSRPPGYRNRAALVISGNTQLNSGHTATPVASESKKVRPGRRQQDLAPEGAAAWRISPGDRVKGGLATARHHREVALHAIRNRPCRSCNGAEGARARLAQRQSLSAPRQERSREGRSARPSADEEGAPVRGCQPRAGTIRPGSRSGGFVARK